MHTHDLALALAQERLQQGHRSRQQARLLGVRQQSHLVRDVLEPGLSLLNFGQHVRNFLPYDRLFDQALAVDRAQMRPFERFFVNDTTVACDPGADDCWKNRVSGTIAKTSKASDPRQAHLPHRSWL